MYNCIVLHFGYVESSRVGMVCCVGPEFETRTEALASLGYFLYLKYKNEFAPLPALTKKCCQISHEKDPDNKFCGRCGNALTPRGLDFVEFAEWLYSLPNITCDDWGGDGCEEWNMWGGVDDIIANRKTLIDLHHDADAFLIDALPLSLLPPEDVKNWRETERDRRTWWRRDGQTTEEYLAKKD